MMLYLDEGFNTQCKCHLVDAYMYMYLMIAGVAV